MKSNQTPPDVEPLSEAAWQRIEHAVFRELGKQPAAVPRAEKPPRSAWRWQMRAALGIALAAAAALAVIPLVSNGDRINTSATEPSRVATAESPVQITVGRTALTVAPHSTIWVSGTGRTEVVIMVEQGAVECAVASSPERPPVVMQAGDVRIEVMGTRFAVARQGASAQVEVFEGAVWVFHRGKRVEIRAGETWSPERSASRDASEAAEAAKASEHELGSASREEAPERAVVEKTQANAPGETEVNANKALSRQRVAAGQPKRTQAAQERYEHAARIEASQPDAAIAIYRELGRGTGSWAANALFAQARLELGLGNRAVAKKLLAEYLRRFPDGLNAEDARALKSSLGN